MKFEKFLKQTGTHGQIYTRDNGDRWLICAGVGMKVPQGIVNLLGVGEVPERVERLVETLIKADTDDKVELTKAVLDHADGKASDIIRVFTGENMIGDRIEIGINNCDFGLLEKSDINLVQGEIEESDKNTQYLLVLNRSGEEDIGFIESVF